MSQKCFWLLYGAIVWIWSFQTTWNSFEIDFPHFHFRSMSRLENFQPYSYMSRHFRRVHCRRMIWCAWNFFCYWTSGCHSPHFNGPATSWKKIEWDHQAHCKDKKVLLETLFKFSFFGQLILKWSSLRNLSERHCTWADRLELFWSRRFQTYKCCCYCHWSLWQQIGRASVCCDQFVFKKPV